jgi:hypothetical protein
MKIKASCFIIIIIIYQCRPCVFLISSRSSLSFLLVAKEWPRICSIGLYFPTKEKEWEEGRNNDPFTAFYPVLSFKSTSNQ